MVLRLCFLALVGMLLVPFACPPLAAEDKVAGQAIPDVLKVPAGHRLLLRAEARGVQIFQAVEGKDGKLVWKHEGPLADLFDAKGKKLGCHYDGPAWEALDGSKVIRDVKQAVKAAPAKTALRDVPWLLIKVKPADDSKGTFAAAVYIQRVETRGGQAPAGSPARVGTRIGVPYRAAYLFYRRAS